MSNVNNEISYRRGFWGTAIGTVGRRRRPPIYMHRLSACCEVPQCRNILILSAGNVRLEEYRA